MLSTKAAVSKPNSLKWRLPTNGQGLTELNNGKAHRNAANVATQYPKNAAKKYQGANTAPSAKA